MKSGNRFINIFFNRYFEQCVNDIPYERLRLLSSRERKLIRSGKLRMLKSTLESKLMLLAKLGRPFVIMVGDTGKKTSLSQLTRLLKIFFRKGGFSTSEAVSEVQQQGFFFISDTDVVRSANILGNIYNDPALYNVVRAYSEINEQQYTNFRMHEKVDKEISALHDLDRLISKILAITHSMSAKGFFEKNYKLDARGYIILAALSRYRQLTMGDLQEKTQMFNLRPQINTLKKNGLVNESGTHVSISGHGELMLGEARNYFLSEVY